MAVYKVIQDIEAEDKLLGPLTLKGFIYAMTAAFLAFLNFKVLTTSALGNFRWIVIIIFGLPMLLFMVLASPLGREQPTEIWLLSRVRFFLKPRSRVWNQTGMSQLVTITAPPKVDMHLTKELTQDEVQGRLKALSTTMDSRGWAIKDVNLNTPMPTYLGSGSGSDRLIDASNIKQIDPISDVRPDDDIMDEKNSPVAKLFAGLMQKKDAEHKNALAEKIKHAKTMHNPPQAQKESKRILRGQPSYHIAKDEGQLNKEFAAAEAAFRTQHSPKKTKLDKPAAKPVTTPVTEENQAGKLELAQSGNDLSVASIEKLANRQPRVEQIGPNEIEISLH